MFVARRIICVSTTIIENEGKMSERTKLMARYAYLAERYDFLGNKALCEQVSELWKALATEYEIGVAPKYIRWYGRPE
jgi:hypothetical protein